MVHNRKASSKKLNEVTSPEEMEIPEDEQWRLVNESGILGKVASIPKPQADDEEDNSFGEEIFNAVVLIIPISSLLLLMEILIHFQYGRHPTLQALVDRMVASVPILSLFIFYTARYKAHRRMQTFLFVLGILAGARLIYLMNRGSWLVNMRQCPPLATIWVYTIVQLELGPAVLSLGIVGIYVWLRGLRIML